MDNRFETDFDEKTDSYDSYFTPNSNSGLDNNLDHRANDSDDPTPDNLWNDIKIKEKFRFFDVTSTNMELKNFYGKWEVARKIIAGEPGEPKKEDEPSAFGILDILFLGIPRFLDYLADKWQDSAHKRLADEMIDQAREAWFPFLFRMFFRVLMSVPFLIQRALGYLLAAVFTVIIPIIPLMNWLYPYIPEASYGMDNLEYVDKVKDPGLLEGKNNRRNFFNPSTWMVPAILLFAISLLIQTFNPGLFLAEAAAPLFIMQTVFASIAGLMLIGAVLSLAVYGIELLVDKQDNGNVNKNNDSTNLEVPKPKSAVAEYFSEFKTWCIHHRGLAALVIGFGVVSVLAILVLTLGFFTGGFGIAPEAFNFMAPVFNFIAEGFIASVKGASALHGLEFLGSFSAEALQVMGQSLSVAMLFATAIFIPDTLRRVFQWSGEKTVVSQNSLQMEDKRIPPQFIADYIVKHDTMIGDRHLKKDTYLQTISVRTSIDGETKTIEELTVATQDGWQGKVCPQHVRELGEPLHLVAKPKTVWTALFNCYPSEEFEFVTEKQYKEYTSKT